MRQLADHAISFVGRVNLRRCIGYSEQDGDHLLGQVGRDDPMHEGRTLDQAVLDEIVRRIVAVAQPKKIILFGSAARGEMGRDSDVDLLVVKDGADRRRTAARIYRRLRGVGAAVDVIVVTPDDVERYRDSHALVIKPALHEGRVVYDPA